MAKVIDCECGFVARGTTDDEVILRHVASDHLDLLTSVDREDLYGWTAEV